MKQLQQARNNLKLPKFHEIPLLLKKSIKELQYHKEVTDKFHVCNISYHLAIYGMIAGRKIKSNVRTKRSKVKRHCIIT